MVVKVIKDGQEIIDLSKIVLTDEVIKLIQTSVCIDNKE